MSSIDYFKEKQEFIDSGNEEFLEIFMPIKNNDLCENLLESGFLLMDSEYDETFRIDAKLGFTRCVHTLEDLKAGKTVKKRASQYQFKANENFDLVWEKINEYHQENWFSKNLVSLLNDFIYPSQKKVQFVTPALYFEEDLVAGDIGLIHGARYLSFTGFYTKSGSGTVFLYALGAFLKKSKYQIWDLGMPLEYKFDLGASHFIRGWFLSVLEKTSKVQMPDYPHDFQANAKELIDTLS